jgi:drug/metabolite transporter (DMT)-like permease
MAIPARGPGQATLWVWIPTFTPLSRAYGFIALAFAITPLAGAALFGEPISFWLVDGIGLIVGGVVCVAG